MMSKMKHVALFLAALFLATAVGVAFDSDSAYAVNCSGDNHADWNAWGDNYVVGTPCDRWGRYTLTIQRINYGLGYTSGGLDGRFGTNTKSNVQSFQTARGITSDGLVGTNTWNEYRWQMQWAWSSSYGVAYKSPNYGHHAYKKYNGNYTDNWWVHGRDPISGGPSNDCNWNGSLFQQSMSIYTVNSGSGCFYD